MRLRNITVGAVLCIALFVAAPAYAQNSGQSGYSSPQGSIQEQITTGNDQPQARTVSVADRSDSGSNQGGNLPFTGFDVMLIVAAGGVLLAMGVGIRRASRSTEVA
jgi:hypothetical protein